MTHDTWDHPTMTREQFATRTAELIAEESQNGESWWWLSICDPGKPEGEQFIGCCIVRASGLLDATTQARRRGCNPGGEVQAVGGIMNPAEGYPALHPSWTYALLTKDESRDATPERLSAPRVLES